MPNADSTALHSPSPTKEDQRPPDHYKGSGAGCIEASHPVAAAKAWPSEENLRMETWKRKAGRQTSA